MPKHPLKIKAKRDAQKQAALQRILEGKKPFACQGQRPEQGRPARGRGHGPDLRRPRRVRQRAATPTSATPRLDTRRSRAPTPPTARNRSASTARCTTRSRRPTGAIDNSTLWQADYNRAHYDGHVLQPDARVLRAPVLGSLHLRRRRHRVGEGALQPGALRPRLLRRHRLRHTTLALRPRRDGRLGRRPARRRQDDGRDPRLPQDLRRRRTATTSTATATTTSPTASSTTSRSSTRVATRRRATRRTAPTRSGATAGTPTCRPAARRRSPGRRTSAPTAALLEQRPGARTTRPASGSATTRSSRRTAASASSRTSTRHDLGLPDLYDTSGNTGGAENNTAFWTLMSSGANIGDGGPDGIGDAPTDMGVWELFQLGWLERPGRRRVRSTTWRSRARSRRTRSRATCRRPTTVRRRSSRVLPDQRGAARARRACRGREGVLGRQSATTSTPR